MQWPIGLELEGNEERRSRGTAREEASGAQAMGNEGRESVAGYVNCCGGSGVSEIFGSPKAHGGGEKRYGRRQRAVQLTPATDHDGTTVATRA